MINIEPIAAFSDNYIWCIHDGTTAWIVDPGDAVPVVRFLRTRQLHLKGILITHHHADHIGGIDELLLRFNISIIYGPQNPAIEQVTHRLKEGDSIDVLGQQFSILEVPGHTLDHIAYVAREMTPPLLFCGDTLFAGGCGRLFEGSAEQMLGSLKKFKQLAKDTRIFCAHEYTAPNLRFAQAVEPDNLAIKRRTQDVARMRADDQPTLPSNLALELETNPFLRTEQRSVQLAALRHSPQSDNEIEIFAAIRRWKDQF